MEGLQKATYNEGFLQLQRLAKLQDDINSVRVNPLAFNLEKNTYNYNIWYMNLCSLFNEAVNKLDETEIKTLQDLMVTIENALKYKPPHISINLLGKNSSSIVVKTKNWEFLYKLLKLLEKEIKITLGLHGLSNPDIEGDTLF